MVRGRVDLEMSGYIQFEGDHTGDIMFVALHGGILWCGTPGDGPSGVPLYSESFNEGDPANGWGWTNAEDEGTLQRHPFFHLGEESGLRIERIGDGW